MSAIGFELEEIQGIRLLRLVSDDGTNRLKREVVLALTKTISELANVPAPLVIAGNERFFSAGADLREIAGLDAASAYEFSRMGQALMRDVDNFPALVYAAISGYCMGGGLDLALACRYRIASAHAVFGHRGAALGLITGWGGTQRLPRLIGRAAALQLFVAAEKLSAGQALRIGLVDAIADDPVAETIRRIQAS
jgi:enoyl-CoA hydratase